MSEELLARIDQLEQQLAEARSIADRALDMARTAAELAEDAERRADDAAGEASYQRDGAERAILRCNEALIDIQGVNLEQRIAQVLSDKIQDGTFNTIYVEQQPRTTLAVEESPIWDRAIQFDVITPSSPFPVATGGTYPVVQSEDSLSESESEDVADYLTSGIVLPDDGAGPSETASPNEVEDEF